MARAVLKSADCACPGGGGGDGCRFHLAICTCSQFGDKVFDYLSRFCRCSALIIVDLVEANDVFFVKVICIGMQVLRRLELAAILLKILHFGKKRLEAGGDNGVAATVAFFTAHQRSTSIDRFGSTCTDGGIFVCSIVSLYSILHRYGESTACLTSL